MALSGLAKTMGGLRSAVRQETCPFCFDRFHLSDTPFRCGALPAKCSWATDEVLEQIWDDARPIGRVIPATGKFRTEAPCENCKTLSQLRLCPHCHQELPAGFAEVRNYALAVVGASNAGKSHFLTTAIETFRNDRGPRLHLNIMPSGDAMRNRYKLGMQQPLYKQKRQLDKTMSAAVRAGSALPLVFTCRIKEQNILGRLDIKAAIFLSFFDAPGEDMETEVNVSNLTRCVYNSDGIIVLIDPLEFEYVRNRLSGLPPLGAGGNRDAIDIISRIADVIRRRTGIGLKTKIKIPIAITMSKMDALGGLIDPSSALKQTIPNVAGFARDDCEAASLDMKAMLASWLTPQIIEEVEDQFETVKYFGVSALGCAPDKAGNIASINPHRVTGPFEWLLYNRGLLKAGDER